MENARTAQTLNEVSDLKLILEQMLDGEVIEWFRMSPQQRFEESGKLWEVFISYGGTSIIFLCISVGILINIAISSSMFSPDNLPRPRTKLV